MPHAIVCRQLFKRYEGRPPVEAVRGIDLIVEEGECFGLLGPNGAGKTTTLEILEGLLDAMSGQVEVLGFRWGRDDRQIRERIGISLQETKLADKLTVRETISLFRNFYRRGIEPDEAMRRVSLVEKAAAHVVKLSGGHGKGKSVVVDICLNDESGNYDVPYEQNLAPLISGRSALLEGDLGPLYVAWLAAAERRLIDDDTPEPCDVSQLTAISAGTQAMAHFLGVSEKLLKAAYQPAQKTVRLDSPQHLAKWVRTLPPSVKDEYLQQFLTEPPTIVRSKLLKQYRAGQNKQSRPAKTSKSANKPRTAAELLALAGSD